MVTDSEMDVVNITHDGHVTKRILRQGVGTFPGENNTVSVHYESFIYDTDSLFDSSRERKTEFSFDLNAGKVVKAWELAIPTMKVGEKAEIVCTSDYGYGDDGRTYIVPKKAKLRFEVELLGFWETVHTASERIASAEKKKLEGNELFKKGATEEALFAYRKAREYVKNLWNCEPEELEQSRFLIVAILLNIAACHTKLKNYDFAIEVCQEALNRDFSNLKTYFRLGKAYFEMGEYTESIKALKMGLELKPSDQALLSLLKTVEEKERHYIKNSTKIYKKMCES